MKPRFVRYVAAAAILVTAAGSLAQTQIDRAAQSTATRPAISAAQG